VLCTLHRASNVDEPRILSGILEVLGQVSRTLPVVFPVHPRTRKVLEPSALSARFPQLRLTEPFGYLDFLALSSQAKLILTDSGGLQEESTALGIPCLTLRENTERPITVTEGTNLVVGTDPVRILAEAEKALRGEGKQGRTPELWDGRASERIADVYEAFLR
jgi:UDP-N-acetylglucosamine 2-epimerase (non-hydrolysing)